MGSRPFLDRYSPTVFLFMILGLMVWAYAPVFHARFVYDDLWTVVRNPAIRSLQPKLFFTDPSTVANAESGLATDIYRPLGVLSLALDYRAWRLWPFPFHVENVLWHGLNGFLVWMVLRRLLKVASGALVGTFLFLMHPVQVQTVAWVSQRSSVLGGAAFLGSLLCLMEPSPPWGSLLLGDALFCAAVFCKETTLVLPLLLGLIEWVIQVDPSSSPRRFSAIMTKYLPLAVIAGVYLGIRHGVLRQWSQTADLSQGVWEPLSQGLCAFPVYIGKLLVPARLRPSYGYPLLSVGQVAGAVIFLGIYITGFRTHLRKAPWIALTLGWVLITLLPVLQMIPIRVFVAERFLYLPVIGLGLGVGGAYGRFPKARWAIGVWSVGLSVLTFLTVPQWQTEETLWAYAVRQEPANAFAQVCYAESLQDLSLAALHYKQALLSQPAEGVRFAALNNLAWIYRRQHQPWKAVFWAKKAVRQRPDDVEALFNLCHAYLDLGKRDDAEHVEKRLQKLLPVSSPILLDLSKEFKTYRRALQ